MSVFVCVKHPSLRTIVVSCDYILTDKSTTVAVISSCFDLLALPFGNDLSIRKLVFRDLETLLSTLRTITSATLGVENERRRRREVGFDNSTPAMLLSK
jgi:hypothetical protein